MLEKSVQKFRLILVVLTPIIIAVGLYTRSGSPLLPAVVAEYGGDTLWAVMAFVAVRFLVPHWSLFRSVLVALAICYLDEISQLYHTPWIDVIRSYRIGGLILGYGFLWGDLVCYTVGVIAAALLEGALRKESKPGRS